MKDAIYSVALIAASLVSVLAPAGANPQTDCQTARAIKLGETATCTGLLVPSSDIRSLLAEVETLTAKIVETEGALELARLEMSRKAVDLRVCEDRVIAIRNTLTACESAKAPPVVECPERWGGWSWIAASAGLAIGGLGGWGIGRATCP